MRLPQGTGLVTRFGKQCRVQIAELVNLTSLPPSVLKVVDLLQTQRGALVVGRSRRLDMAGIKHVMCQLSRWQLLTVSSHLHRPFPAMYSGHTKSLVCLLTSRKRREGQSAHLRHRVDDEKERQLAVAARGQLIGLGQAPRLVQRQAAHVAAARQGAVHAAPQLLKGVKSDLTRIQLPCTPTPRRSEAGNERVQGFIL